MRDLDSIIEEIREFSKANELLSYREVEELQNVLYEDEVIIHITIGSVEGYKGLFLATVYRVLFIYHNEISQPKVLEVPYEKLEYIHVKQLNHYVAMELFFAGTKIEIKDLPPDDANTIKDEVNFQIGIYNPSNKTGSSQKKKKFGFLRFILFIGIAVLTGYLLGPKFHVIEVYDSVITDALSKEEGEATYQIEFSNMELVKDEFGATAKGTLTNHSDKEYRYVNIDVQYYDKEGTIVESQIETVYDLKPEQSWNFDFSSYSDYTDSFDIVGIYVQEAE